MKKLASCISVLVLCYCSIAQAALPVVREVQWDAAVHAVGSDRLPVGAIDYSSSRVSRDHWDRDTWRDRSESGLIFLDDGSVHGEGTHRRYERYAHPGSRCQTVGKVTTCRTEPLAQ